MADRDRNCHQRNDTGIVRCDGDKPSLTVWPRFGGPIPENADGGETWELQASPIALAWGKR
jgi:hypothetical protein